MLILVCAPSPAAAQTGVSPAKDDLPDARKIDSPYVERTVRNKRLERSGFQPEAPDGRPRPRARDTDPDLAGIGREFLRREGDQAGADVAPGARLNLADRVHAGRVIIGAGA